MAARIMVMAGGTGGHVFPALAVAQELQARGWEVFWLGTPDSFEERIVPTQGFVMDRIAAHRLRGQGVLSALLAPFRLLHAVIQAWRALRERRPEVVLGFGGFVTGPGGIASRLLGLPLVIHEQNAIPGLTNRWLARVAKRVLEAFPASFPAARKAVLTGNPVRREITALAAPLIRLQQHSGGCRILVVGGSLGAAVLNETLPQALRQMQVSVAAVVRHQAGRGKLDQARDAYLRAEVEASISEFLDDMAEAYAWADLVICRAGALTVSELAAVGVAAILVPYPYAVDDHQTHNARYLADAGAAVLIPQPALTAAHLASVLTELVNNPGQLLKMAQAARQLARVDATSRVADICQEVRAA